MREPMLVAFEGQDGAGKSAVLEALGLELRAWGYEVETVEEFSTSGYGARLVDALAADKFLRPVAGQDATPVTRALEIAADLHFLDARVIAPAVARGSVVLKDRHLDTVLYTLAPALLDADVFAEENAALRWLRALVEPLSVLPAVTVYIDAPLDVRLGRIGARVPDLPEHRANKVSDDDLCVFRVREDIARRLIAAEPDRFLIVDNSGRSIENVVQELTEAMIARLPLAPGR